MIGHRATRKPPTPKHMCLQPSKMRNVLRDRLTTLQARADQSPATVQLNAVQQCADGLPSYSDHPIQRKFLGDDGEWMQDINDETLVAKFGATTVSLWSALRKTDEFVIIRRTGSGASYSFVQKVLSINSDWYDKIKDYVENGTKASGLSSAIAAFTHEMSHAHDVRVKGETPEGASKDTDAYVTAVLKTELKAWMKEARSARENSRMAEEAKVQLDADSVRVIKGWLAVYFTLEGKGDILAINGSGNLVVGRLMKYFNDNKSSETSTTLAGLLAGNSGALMADIVNYAGQIKAKYTSDDSVLRNYCKNEMK